MEYRKSNRYKNYCGQRFGRLLVLEYLGQDHKNKSVFKCQCDCKKEKICRGNDLKSGQIRSCGCLLAETASKKCSDPVSWEKLRKGLRTWLDTGDNRIKKNKNLSILKTKKDRKGRSMTEESKRWAKDIYLKFDYTCQKCLVRGKRLNAHHIKSWKDYPENRFDLNNGVCLCKECHDEFHQIYGYKTSKPEDVFEYLLSVQFIY